MDTDVNQVPVSEEPKPAEVVTETVPQPGEKTESALLLKSLQEVRAEKKELEAEIARLQSQQVVTEPISDEGRMLKSQIDHLQSIVLAGENQKQMSALEANYPALKDKSAEFEAFRTNPENAGMKIETAAKAFLAENDLLAPPVQRKGLERDTGGGRVVPQQGLSPSEIGELRVNNYRKYSQLVREGKIKID